jgi:DNA-binding LacI/PurR family transcriptional regulator
LNSKTSKSPNLLEGTTLRPKERVLQYLEEQLQKLDLPSGSRLPTSRALAARLNVSASTVQGVFRDLAEQGLIQTQVGNGSFLLKSPAKARNHSTGMRIGLTFGFAQDAERLEPTHLSIAGAILSAASELASSVSIVPLQFQPKGQVSPREFLAAKIKQTDGLILRGMPGWLEAEQKLASENFPLVHLNPPSPTATGDFVSINFFEAGRKIGSAFLAGGRKRVSFLHAGSRELAPTSMLRCSGLLAALGSSIGHSVTTMVEVAKEHSLEAARQAAKRMFADRKHAPDAIYTTSGELALGLLDFCADHGIRVPEDLAIVSGTGVSSSAEEAAGITRELYDTRQIGIELLRMILTRVEEKGRSQPAIYIDTSFITGKTTLPEENQGLQADGSG